MRSEDGQTQHGIISNVYLKTVMVLPKFPCVYHIILTSMIEPKCKYIIFMFDIIIVITKILSNLIPVSKILRKIYGGVLSYMIQYMVGFYTCGVLSEGVLSEGFLSWWGFVRDSTDIMPTRKDNWNPDIYVRLALYFPT